MSYTFNGTHNVNGLHMYPSPYPFSPVVTGHAQQQHLQQQQQQTQPPPPSQQHLPQNQIQYGGMSVYNTTYNQPFQGGPYPNPSYPTLTHYPPSIPPTHHHHHHPLPPHTQPHFYPSPYSSIPSQAPVFPQSPHHFYGHPSTSYQPPQFQPPVTRSHSVRVNDHRANSITGGRNFHPQVHPHDLLSQESAQRIPTPSELESLNQRPPSLPQPSQVSLERSLSVSDRATPFELPSTASRPSVSRAFSSTPDTQSQLSPHEVPHELSQTLDDTAIPSLEEDATETSTIVTPLKSPRSNQETKIDVLESSTGNASPVLASPNVLRDGLFPLSPSSRPYHIVSTHPRFFPDASEGNIGSLFISHLLSVPKSIQTTSSPSPLVSGSSQDQKLHRLAARAAKGKRASLRSSVRRGHHVGSVTVGNPERNPPQKDPEGVVTSQVEYNSAKIFASSSPASTNGTGTNTTPASSFVHTPTPKSPLSSNISISSPPKQGVERPPSDHETGEQAPQHLTNLGALPTGDSVETPLSSAAGMTKATKPAPLVKSFASLLRPSPWSSASKPSQDGGVQTSTPKSSDGIGSHPSGVALAHTDQSSSSQLRPAIPTSSQVGFSVPALDAEDKEHHALAALAPRQHANLLQLLKSGTSLVSRGNEPGTTSPLKPHIIPRGLVNTGNICFANAILQALVYTPPFWRLFDELGKSGLITERQGRDTPITSAVITFINEFKPNSGPGPIDDTSFPEASAASSREAKHTTSKQHGVDSSPLRPLPKDPMVIPRNSFKAAHLYSSLRSNARFDAMRLGQQEDAEEFLGFFLDSLHEELCRLLNLLGDTGPSIVPPQPNDGRSDLHDNLSGDNISMHGDDDWQEVGKRNRAVVTRTIKSSESAITSIFGGKFRSVLRASGRPDSASIEEWRCLQLDIQPPHIKTIEDALHSLSTIETVSIQSRQGISMEATKQMLIEQLPPILILHLKRFVYDPIIGIGKNTKVVRFGPDLDIRSDLLSPNGRRGQVQKYKLYGVVYHHGLQATGGHYTLDVLHPNPLEHLESSFKDMNKHSQQPQNKPTSSERWVRFNDEVVRLLTPENVFGRTGPWGQELVDDARTDSREDKAAYLLLYRRVLK